MANDDEAWPVVLIFFMFIYWLLVFAGIWIYEGFKENKTSQDEPSKVIGNEIYQLSERLLIAKFRELAKAKNCAPTEKTSDQKIVKIYGLVGSNFRQVASIRGEDIPAKNLNSIVFKFIQVHEQFGEGFFLENLKYELEKYQQEGLRQDYLEQEITFV